MRLWDVAAGRCYGICRDAFGPVTSISFSPDGTLLAVGSADTIIMLWHLREQRRLAVFVHRRDGWAAYTPDGRYKVGGQLGGAFWHAVALCRFEPGELDAYLPGLRVPDGEPLLVIP